MTLVTVNSVIRITETTLSNPINEAYFEGSGDGGLCGEVPTSSKTKVIQVKPGHSNTGIIEFQMELPIRRKLA